MKFVATFWRGNPQLKNDGYWTTRTIEAKNTRQAMKKAREYENCVYGTMILDKMEKIEENTSR